MKIQLPPLRSLILLAIVKPKNGESELKFELLAYLTVFW